MRTVFIFDDYDHEDTPKGDRDTAIAWEAQLSALLPRDEYCVELVQPDRLMEQLEILEKRQEVHRAGETFEYGDAPIDSVDLLIVDFDLLYLPKARGVSGEDIAYLARCFSTCGLIVGVNRFKKQGDFNLNLFSPLDSYSDYDVQGVRLTDPGLWFPAPATWGEFRPWYWPALTVEMCNFHDRVAQVKAAMNEPILGWFGFSDEAKRSLPRTLGSFLEGSGVKYETVTFADFVRHSPNALRGKEEGLPMEFAARVAAARIHAWLERALLPRLDILVDAPHLVQEYASLVSGAADVDSWNETAHLTQPNVDTDKLGDDAWSREAWLSRKAWWRDKVANNERIAEVRDPWGAPRPDLIFCEDISRFRPKAQTRRFVADTNSGFAQRYVTKGLDGYSYSPAARLAM